MKLHIACYLYTFKFKYYLIVNNLITKMEFKNYILFFYFKQRTELGIYTGTNNEQVTEKVF